MVWRSVYLVEADKVEERSLIPNRAESRKSKPEKKAKETGASEEAAREISSKVGSKCSYSKLILKGFCH